MNFRRLNRLGRLVESLKKELSEASGPYANAQKFALQAVEALIDAGLTIDARKVKQALPVRDQESAQKLLKQLEMAVKSAAHLGQDDAVEIVGSALDIVQQAADFMIQKGLEQPVAKAPRYSGEYPESIIVRLGKPVA